MQSVSSDPVGYRMRVYTILDGIDIVIEVWRKLVREGSSSPYYVGRCPVMPGGPPWYPAVFKLTDNYKESNRNFSNKFMAILHQEGLPCKKVGIDILLHNLRMDHKYLPMKPWDNEKEGNQKLDEFADKLAQMLISNEELSVD
ncbi:MAG: hypothetical protein QMD36_05365 [Candidatus Aenigmarchaeota archaeon]|nr:hypothetical protein [Candidatus Aenigmarchaeota archaeon]